MNAQEFYLHGQTCLATIKKISTVRGEGIEYELGLMEKASKGVYIPYKPLPALWGYQKVNGVYRSKSLASLHTKLHKFIADVSQQVQQLPNPGTPEPKPGNNVPAIIRLTLSRDEVIKLREEMFKQEPSEENVRLDKQLWAIQYKMVDPWGVARDLDSEGVHVPSLERYEIGISYDQYKDIEAWLPERHIGLQFNF